MLSYCNKWYLGLVSLIDVFNDLFTAPMYYFDTNYFGQDLFVAFIFIETIRVFCFHLFVQSQPWKHQNNVSKLFKVDTKDTRMTSFWCLYYYLWTDFTHCSGDSIVDFEQANADWIITSTFRLTQFSPVLHFIWKPVMTWSKPHNDNCL